MTVDLSLFKNDYDHGSLLKRIFWLFCSVFFIESKLPFPMKLKVFVLRFFGAKIQSNVVIKPSVKIKYPWLLEIGCNSWVGEGVWIDNLAPVIIGNNCCLSQGAYLLTGNHDFRKESFDLILNNININNGSWVGAKSIVCPGVTLNTNSVLAVGSIATFDLEENHIYQGNPATKKR